DLAPLGTGRRVVFALEGGQATGPCTLALGEVLVHGSRAPARTVLVITSDTHRGDHLGFRASTLDLATPTIDAIAARGVSFTRALASSPNTLPSHSALMTGQHPLELGMLSNYNRLSSGFETLAERFAAAGYVTLAAASSRNLDHVGSGLGRGFDRYSAPDGALERPAAETLSALTGWLDELGDAPVFVWLHFFDAHQPYDPPADLAPPLPDERNAETYREWLKACYRAEIESLDRELGTLLARDRFDTAVVCFTSDHGESLGGHGIDFDHISVYPDVVHVPLLMAWPGAPKGERVDDLVQQRDVARTVLELAGLDANGFAGRPLLADRDPADPVFALDADARSISITEGTLHLMLSLREHELHPGSAENRTLVPRHRVELYDLARDPEALHDLSTERADDARRLRAEVLAYLRRVPLRGELQASKSEALIRDLEALGYATPSVTGAGEAWFEDDCACEFCAAFE
ncbi:MAG: sulfatase, partial [Planctomycetota bacterium]